MAGNGDPSFVNVLSSTGLTSGLTVEEGPGPVFNMREIWFTNMLLLGFNPVASEKKYKIQFNKDMFAVPPQKQGMEVILHYLFSVLNSHLCYEEFRDCWPVYDRKQDQLFRKKSSNWISNIAKEEPNSGLPRIVAPLLLSPGGDKFYSFLYLFSTYCLWKVTLRESSELGVQIPSSVHSLNSSAPVYKDVNEESTCFHIIKECNEYLSMQEELALLHKQWREYSKEISLSYRQLCKERTRLENELNIMMKKDTSTFDPQLKLSPRESNKTKVRLLWKKVETFLESNERERQTVRTVMESTGTSKHTISGKELSNVKVPKGLMTQQIRVTDDDGNINLIELLKICTAGMNYLNKHFEKGVCIPDLSHEVDFSSKSIRAHTSHLLSVQQLNKSLCSLDEELVQRIAELEKELRVVRLTSNTPPPISSMILLNNEAPPIATPTETTPTPVNNKLYHLHSPITDLTTPSSSLTTPTSLLSHRPIIFSAGRTPVDAITKSVLSKARLKATPIEATPTTRKTLRFNSPGSNLTPVVRKVGVIKTKEREQTSSKRKDPKPVIRTSQTGTGKTERKSTTPREPTGVPAPLAAPPSPTELLANRITDNITSDSTPYKVDLFTDERMAFQSVDCIYRTPSHPPVSNLATATPLRDSDWLNKVTPPTPYCETSSDDNSPTSLTPPFPLIDNKN
ncbi:PREDICTED: uncharacterized protein LOC109583112 [Amphimedon queenslandica]|uniref:HAUS augmin-like complex subunit 6 N-terminal domain-containing protein n=1 Tax=Amphimedon queenslandica TaxID=400682 RepID=A0A1X7UIK6_AMPQE|nr:PREDICTED: uncharacterized protein LOC109583112 [Amphimedon queenslandica]|eukprot:XP_019853861.1 PREDICTED: uncharacterized protein LOC109583112 [Amphimedon queenslandica]